MKTLNALIISSLFSLICIFQLPLSAQDVFDKTSISFSALGALPLPEWRKGITAGLHQKNHYILYNKNIAGKAKVNNNFDLAVNYQLGHQSSLRYNFHRTNLIRSYDYKGFALEEGLNEPFYTAFVTYFSHGLGTSLGKGVLKYVLDVNYMFPVYTKEQLSSKIGSEFYFSDGTNRLSVGTYKVANPKLKISISVLKEFKIFDTSWQAKALFDFNFKPFNKRRVGMISTSSGRWDSKYYVNSFLINAFFLGVTKEIKLSEIHFLRGGGYVSEDEIMSSVGEDFKNIYFEQSKANLTNLANKNLESLVDFLNGQTEMKVAFIGHTSLEGNLKMNKKLSVKRAKTCQTFLINHGIAKSRVKIIGEGSKMPNSKNKQALNRRVEVFIIK